MTPAEDLNKQYRSRFLRKQAAFDRKYQHLFDKIASDFAMLSTDPNIKFAKAFRFPAYINERIKVMTTDFHDQMLGAIEDDVTDFWSMSNQKNDKLVADYLKTIGTIKASQEAAYFMPNTPALKAFLSQPRGTESLSKRVWNLTEQLQTEMEINLGIGIANGDSADVISRRIRQYLKNPDALFRRVRTPAGRLVASEAMKNYHPGRGRYRSAYKNAMRLARTETNMAYHAADLLRWQQMDMVKGYEVKLSASHHIYDICDLCQGIYPKTFVWVSWHSQCLCSALPILLPQEEFLEYLRGGKKETNRFVSVYPDNFKKYVRENFDRYSKYKTTPFWMADNKKVIAGIVKKQ